MKPFLSNLHELSTFGDDTIKAMLVHGYEFNPGDRYVVDLSEFELTDGSYLRQTIMNNNRIVDTTASSIHFGADDIDFGPISNEVTDGLILYKQNANDLDSPLLFYWQLDEVGLVGLSSFEITFSPSGIATFTSQG